MQNNRVVAEVESMYFSNFKDKNSIMAYRSYFGIIEEIRQIGYVVFNVPLFKCKWIDSNTCVQTDELGFTRVHTHIKESFIMTSQEK